MFFGSGSALPFHTVKEGISHYPEWRLAVPKSGYGYIQSRVDAKDPDYLVCSALRLIRYWQT